MDSNFSSENLETNNDLNRNNVTLSTIKVEHNYYNKDTFTNATLSEDDSLNGTSCKYLFYIIANFKLKYER